MAAEVFAPSIASALMLRDPWIPMFIGNAVVVLGSACMIFVPETFNRKPVNGSVEMTNIDSNSSSCSSPDLKHPILSRIRATCFEIIDNIRTHASIPVLLLLATFFSQLLSRQTFDLIMRYISKRFSWTLAKTSFLLSLRASSSRCELPPLVASFLLSLRAGINVILFVAVLPFLSRILTSSLRMPGRFPTFNFNLSTSSKDLLLARLSLLLYALGAPFLGLSAFPSLIGDSDKETFLPITIAITGLIVYTLGMGYSAFCRSLVTTLVDQRHVARPYLFSHLSYRDHWFIHHRSRSGLVVYVGHATSEKWYEKGLLGITILWRYGLYLGCGLWHCLG
jgi:hypothetical protein